MSAHSRLKVKTGRSVLTNEKEAAQELADAISQPQMKAAIVFCSSRYDLDELASELKKRFSCPLIGCTTAGEISSKGYQDGGITGASLSSPELMVHSYTISPLSQFTPSQGRELANAIRRELSPPHKFERETMFGLLLIDGLSMLEEQVISELYSQFEGISIVGGSAGDDLRFKTTGVYSGGRFVSDAAVFTLVETTLPFLVFKTQHFQPTDTKMVITDAEPHRRLVAEINAEPAAEEYARMLGLDVDQLNSTVFSEYPLMLKVGDEWYVRSIQRVNKDKSLTFYCAIEVGLVMTLAKGVDPVSNLKEKLEELALRIPNPQLLIGCDCILRKLEIVEKGIQGEVAQLLKDLNFVGFSTYGEQFDSIHVNQTLACVAIGR
ncbi:MAG: FIST N-terminal domain-containing protein [Thermodesulfobacteriota bacterium]|nr:FIST N-terminal domain-containing protein [Thermodesulfobacteriota bacterium]